jgi:hypothetical protein
LEGVTIVLEIDRRCCSVIFTCLDNQYQAGSSFTRTLQRERGGMHTYSVDTLFGEIPFLVHLDILLTPLDARMRTPRTE